LDTFIPVSHFGIDVDEKDARKDFSQADVGGRRNFMLPTVASSAFGN
jgi:hypothetical protein